MGRCDSVGGLESLLVPSRNCGIQRVNRIEIRPALSLRVKWAMTPPWAKNIADTKGGRAKHFRGNTNDRRVIGLGKKLVTRWPI